MRSLPLLVETVRQLGPTEITVFWPLPYRRIKSLEAAFRLVGVNVVGAGETSATASGTRIVFARQVDEDRQQYLSELATQSYELGVQTLFVIDSEDTLMSSGPKFVDKYAFTSVEYKHVWEMNRRHGYVKPRIVRSMNLAFNEIAGGLGEDSIPLIDLFTDQRLTTRLPWSYQLSQIRRECTDSGEELHQILNPWIDVAATLESLGAKDVFGSRS